MIVKQHCFNYNPSHETKCRILHICWCYAGPLNTSDIEKSHISDFSTRYFNPQNEGGL